MSVVKVYYDLMSLPCRALYIVLELTQTPYEKVVLSLGKGEHLTEAFRGINRFQKVPCIDDNGFQMQESFAIVGYLDSKRPIGNLYPKIGVLRARIDEYMSWQNMNLLLTCKAYYQHKILLPYRTGQTTSDEDLAAFKRRANESLDLVENLWLAGAKKFIVSDTLTIADIWAACAIEQPRFAGLEPTENRPKLKAWHDRVTSSLGPLYTEAHEVIHKILDSAKETHPQLFN